ncbi:MAG TPA: efflux RND transporter periplasmic adaptor subunit [Xanthobacteraceae bacterium]|nr:efflux RND transporter periplasmic adaptor subunit [Xanthobacteraceae bacterium]
MRTTYRHSQSDLAVSLLHRIGRLALCTITVILILANRTPLPPAHAAENAPKLAPIQVSPEKRQLIGLTFAPVEEKDLTDRIETTALIEPDQELEGYAQTRFAGWIRQVFVDQTYQYVKRGQPLFTIYSPDLVSAENEYLLALNASRQMADSSIEGVASGANSLVEAALTRLRLFGVSPREIARLERERTVRDTVAIDSPMTGYVVERNALPNMYVQPETRLYSITNLSTVWAYAAVFQNQLGEVTMGDPVSVTVDAYPGRTFDGRVDFIWQAIDPNTRTARVRCAFPNPEGLLKLGMYARIILKPRLGRALAVPDSGVFRTGTHDIVFIDRGDGYLQPVEVELGAHAGHEFVVRKGLRAGERIVSSANFLVDSESQLQAALGTFAPPPPGASAASNAPSGSIDITTKPSPPHKGSNEVLITVRDSTGRSVTDANVSVVFFMPAMPAMGMSAMRVEATARPAGNGVYAATITLESGGTWSVTVVATRAGQQIAGRQLSLSATGGM